MCSTWSYTSTPRSSELQTHPPVIAHLWVHVTVPQVPSEDWAGGYGGGDAVDSGGEIPCRRMRSGSYIKAMGDDDSADSDTSPKASPKSTLIAQRDAFKRSASMDQRLNATNSGSRCETPTLSSLRTTELSCVRFRYSCKQCTDAYPNSRTTPKTHTRSRSYTRSLTSTQVNRCSFVQLFATETPISSFWPSRSWETHSTVSLSPCVRPCSGKWSLRLSRRWICPACSELAATATYVPSRRAAHKTTTASPSSPCLDPREASKVGPVSVCQPGLGCGCGGSDRVLRACGGLFPGRRPGEGASGTSPEQNKLPHKRRDTLTHPFLMWRLFVSTFCSQAYSCLHISFSSHRSSWCDRRFLWFSNRYKSTQEHRMYQCAMSFEWASDFWSSCYQQTSPNQKANRSKPSTKIFKQIMSGTPDTKTV